jgi:hypothetical protein
VLLLVEIHFLVKFFGINNSQNKNILSRPLILMVCFFMKHIHIKSIHSVKDWMLFFRTKSHKQSHIKDRRYLNRSKSGKFM